MKKKNVLHILSSLGLGGTERLIFYLAKYWKNPNIKIHICTLFSKDDPKDEPLLEEIEKLGYKIFRLSLKSWRDFSTYKTLKDYISKNNINIVHSHSGKCEFWGPILSIIANNKIKNIVSQHHTNFKSDLQNKIKDYISKKFLAFKYVAVSNTIKSDLLKRYRLNPDKIILIYNPVDTTKFDEINSSKIQAFRSSINVTKDNFLIGNTSRFVPQKGFEYFFLTAKKIVASQPNFKFLILVSKQDKIKIRELIRKYDLGDCIVMYDRSPDISFVIKSLDLFLFTSIRGEGFGMVLTEALAAGVPIVASNIGPTKEIINNNYNGLLPTPKKWQYETDYLDSNLLAEAILKIYNDNNLRNKLIENGYESLEPFSIENYINNLESLYRSVLK